MFTRNLLVSICVCFCILTLGALQANDYILYLRARGALGKELRTYWDDVKADSDISHKAITNYPPHCSLTGFFPATKSKKTYINAVNAAMESLGNTPRTISILGLIQGNATSKLDYIKLSSNYALAVTKAFMINASIPSQYLKNPNSFTYHISLRNHVFQKNVKKKMKKIQSLEKKINLHANASWSFFLYERDNNGDLSVIEEFPL